MENIRSFWSPVKKDFNKGINFSASNGYTPIKPTNIKSRYTENMNQNKLVNSFDGGDQEPLHSGNFNTQGNQKKYSNRHNLLQSINQNMFNNPREGLLNSYVNNIPMKSDENSTTINTMHSQVPNSSKHLDNTRLEEVSDNLELFKLEITNNFRKIQKNQSKHKPKEILEELDEFKNVFRDTIENNNKKRETDIKNLLDDFMLIKNEVSQTIKDESLKNNDSLDTMVKEISIYKNDMANRVEELEKTIKFQKDQVKMLLMNSTDDKTKKLVERFLIDNREEFEKNKTTYMKPSNKELNEVIGDLKKKKEMTNLKFNRKDTLSEDKSLLNKVSSRRLKNTDLKIDIINEEEEEKNLEEFKINKLSDVSQKVKYERREEFKKNLPIIQDKCYKYDNHSYKLKPINRFKKHVYVVWMQLRLYNAWKECNNHVRIEALRFFVNNYSGVTDSLKNWEIKSTKTAFKSIKDFEKLELEMRTPTFNSNNDNTKERFIKLTTRLKSFIEQLSMNITINKLNYDIVSFIKILITNNSIIPYKFFTLFEISRLNIHMGKVINLTENQKLMVVVFYIFIKIFVKYLLGEIKTITKANIKKNFKMVASVFLHSIINYFKTVCPVFNSVKNTDNLAKAQSENSLGQTNILKEKTKNGVDKAYLRGLKKYMTNLEEKAKKMTNGEEKTLLNQINSSLPKLDPDDDANDVQILSSELFKSADMETYFLLEKKQNSDIVAKIIECAKKLIGMTTNSKDGA